MLLRAYLGESYRVFVSSAGFLSFARCDGPDTGNTIHVHRGLRFLGSAIMTGLRLHLVIGFALGVMSNRRRLRRQIGPR